MVLQPHIAIPNPSPAEGRIFFGISDLRIRAKCAKLLRSFGYSVDSGEPMVLIADGGISGLNSILRLMAEELAADEFAAVRVYVTANAGEAFSVSTVLKMTGAPEVAARFESEWLLSVLQSGSLKCHFQPMVRMQSGDVVGHECLLRAFDAAGRPVPPARVFATARDLKLHADVDLTARLSAIRAASELGIDGRFFVNFDHRSCDDAPSTITPTIEAAAESGLAADRFVFELTGTGGVTDVEHAKRVSQLFRDAGFGIALDDVEPGYRSLQLVSELHPDFVKLDMRLTRCIRLDNLRQAVARHMLDRTRKEGVLTVVEGIESADEWDWCREHGADYAQGFYFAPPAEIPVHEPTNPLFRVSV